MSIPQQPSCKKVCGPQEGYCEERCKIQGSSQEMAMMVGWLEKFSNNISGEWSCFLHFSLPNSPELLLLKFLPLTSNHSHLLARHHIFFTVAFLGVTHLFYSWAVLDFFCNCLLWSWYIATIEWFPFLFT